MAIHELPRLASSVSPTTLSSISTISAQMTDSTALRESRAIRPARKIPAIAITTKLPPYRIQGSLKERAMRPAAIPVATQPMPLVAQRLGKIPGRRNASRMSTWLITSHAFTGPSNT